MLEIIAHRSGSHVPVKSVPHFQSILGIIAVGKCVHSPGLQVLRNTQSVVAQSSRGMSQQNWESLQATSYCLTHGQEPVLTKSYANAYKQTILVNQMASCTHDAHS